MNALSVGLPGQRSLQVVYLSGSFAFTLRQGHLAENAVRAYLRQRVRQPAFALVLMRRAFPGAA
jgi:hypothetical protein